jgi:hypothetical protein
MTDKADYVFVQHTELPKHTKQLATCLKFKLKIPQITGG